MIPNALLLGALAALSNAAITNGAFVPSTGKYSFSNAFPCLKQQALTVPRMSSDWSDFAYDDPDDLDPIDTRTYADENDSQEYKATIGSQLESPDIDWHGDPIFVPQGSVLPLTVENVQGVLAACREEIGTMFGYSAENRGVGITGGVDFIELDGPSVVVHLKGRFWHQRTTVLDRVGAYIMGRIPEVVDVYVADEWELTDEANDEAL
eukprot:CAMPEP_0197440850 /NCGR_PEP_ID=MMETSP1175-20131217/7249_1 /TAXON_ID=1003142 /ORGANISM="Triceratium dubium, Strain CCMP147" /LENGTH=207 /DNA_ID=CAMNT_0042971029 /DNA_START=65 /DNA_END=688 /DNA_ORIENTATION=+